MKNKKMLLWVMSVLLCVVALSVAAMAAKEIPAPVNPKAALDNDVPEAYLYFTDEIVISFTTPDSLRQMLANDEIYNITVQMDWSINSENDWKCTGVNDWSSLGEYGSDMANIVKGEELEWITVFRSNYGTPAEYGYENICYGITDSGDGYLNLTDNKIYFKLRYYSNFADTDEVVYSDWTEVFTIGGSVDDEITASDWAKPELEKAKELGLIPTVLDGADLTKPITRAEFAAVSVKAYEKLSGTAAIPAVNNPFTDTKDVEVLKAYNTGITSGVSADKFDPDALLNREQAATMLTRTFKAACWEGWTLELDSTYIAHTLKTVSPHGEAVYLNVSETANNTAGGVVYNRVTMFADDKDISSWAKDSVYFMAANGIINGVGDNKFAPKNVTSEDQAKGYANATREQALIIAVRMVENLNK